MTPITHSEALNEIATALAKAQGKIRAAQKDSINPHYKNKYADLASCWEACRDALAENGISVVQSPSTVGAVVSVTTMLLHSSGQWICGTVSALAKDGFAQSIGSVITYLRRYSLCSFVGIAPEDDDGSAGTPQQTPKKAYPAPIPTTPVVPPVFELANVQMANRLRDQLLSMEVPADQIPLIAEWMQGKPMVMSSLKEGISATAHPSEEIGEEY